MDPIPRPCERCEATLQNAEYGSAYNPMCAETQIAHGVITWLCFDCRKAWHYQLKKSNLTKEYSIASLKLEHWKTLLAFQGMVTLEEGLKLWNDLDAIESRLSAFASQWLKDN